MLPMTARRSPSRSCQSLPSALSRISMVRLSSNALRNTSPHSRRSFSFPRACVGVPVIASVLPSPRAVCSGGYASRAVPGRLPASVPAVGRPSSKAESICSFKPSSPRLLFTFMSQKSLNRFGSLACSPVAKVGRINFAPTACSGFVACSRPGFLPGSAAVIVTRHDEHLVGKFLPQRSCDGLKVAGVERADDRSLPPGGLGDHAGRRVSFGNDDGGGRAQLPQPADDVETTFFARPLGEAFGAVFLDVLRGPNLCPRRRNRERRAFCFPCRQKRLWWPSPASLPDTECSGPVSRREAAARRAGPPRLGFRGFPPRATGVWWPLPPRAPPSAPP